MGAERVEVFCFHLFAKPFVSISLLRQPHASRLLWPLRGHSARFLRARAREQNVCSQQQVQNGREKGSIGERRGRKEESEGGCERESLWPRPAAFRSSREKEEETLLARAQPPSFPPSPFSRLLLSHDAGAHNSLSFYDEKNDNSLSQKQVPGSDAAHASSGIATAAPDSVDAAAAALSPAPSPEWKSPTRAVTETSLAINSEPMTLSFKVRERGWGERKEREKEERERPMRSSLSLRGGENEETERAKKTKQKQKKRLSNPAFLLPPPCFAPRLACCKAPHRDKQADASKTTN